MDPAGFVPLVFSPLKYTNTVRTKDKNEERKKSDPRVVFPFLAIKKKKKEKKKPSYNPNASTSLPNSEKEAGLARKRRRGGGGGGKLLFVSSSPAPLASASGL